MKKLLLIVCCLLPVAHLQAQDTLASDTAKQKFAKNTVFVELLGNGLLYSLNYDRILFSRKKIKISGRVGGEYSPPFTSVPLELCLLIGKKHHAELGLGLTYFPEIILPGLGRGTHKIDINRSSTYLTIRMAGYRFQKPGGGVFIKAGFGLMYYFFVYDYDWLFFKPKFAWPLLGLGMGYTFKPHKQ